MMFEGYPNPIALAAIVSLAGLLPLGLSTCTAFVKISIVLTILRNALGLQQTPPNVVLNAGALVLTAYVMYPVALQIAEVLPTSTDGGEGLEQMTTTLPLVAEKIRDFMYPLIHPKQLEFFLHTAAKIWPAEVIESIEADDFLIVLPAFFASEMQSAIELGIIIFIPFLIIDLLVANILMALGMIMVPPTVIALPIKLMFFVGINGWSLIVDRLLSSYATAV